MRIQKVTAYSAVTFFDISDNIFYNTSYDIIP